jgi:hypothetical protein
MALPAGTAAGEDPEFAVAGQEFDVDVVFDLLPVLAGEVFLQFGQAAIGGADKVSDGGFGGAHFSQRFLGGDTAVHDPDAPLPAVAGGDFF